MSNNEQSRLDRLEALAESILAGLQETRNGLQETRDGLQETRDALQETRDGLQETRAIANSNAKSIQALSGEWQKDREQWEKDRKGIYQLLGHLTRSMSDFYEVQSDFYNRFDQIDSRQSDMTQILKELKGEQKNPNDTEKS